MSENLYLPGTEIELWGLRWEVIHAAPMGDQTLVRLRGTGGAFSGSEVDVLTPFEEVRPVVHEIDPTRPTHLANWLVFYQAFLLEQALGPNALLAPTPGRLRIELYQLVPVARCLRFPRPRLLLADDVGLGKTIEAGLVITELIARRRANRILIVTPAGPLLDQWREEMAQRFGLRLVIADRAELERVRKGTELGTNPFDHLPLALASMDYLKQDRVLDWLDRSNDYDLVILDEAHHYSDSGPEDYDRADASQRRKLALVLAKAADALLLLSATPHDGHDRSFASLLELLDEERVLARLVAKYERQRSKLRFVPNTLGLGQLEMPDENVLEKLLHVVPEMQPDRPAFSFITQEDPDVQALLQEIDASLNRFEATAKSHQWLADEGPHAGELDRQEAESARQAGQKAGQVDLTRFVQDAVVVEGGDCQTTTYGFDLRLPDTWRHGLQELPGWDAERGRMRITKNLAVLATDKNEPVGFLGRAHPLVQRAIDRVRHLAWGRRKASTAEYRRRSPRTVRHPGCSPSWAGSTAVPAGRWSRYSACVSAPVYNPPCWRARPTGCPIRMPSPRPGECGTVISPPGERKPRRRRAKRQEEQGRVRRGHRPGGRL